MTNDVYKRAETAQENPVTVFEFTGKGSDVLEIPMNVLSTSIRRESGLAGIRSIPVQYWTLYTAILNMIAEQDMNYQEKEIYVQNNSSKAYLTDVEKEQGYNQKCAPIGRWRFDKIISIIQLPNIVERSEEGIANARNSAIGITLNKEGLSVSFGMNVWACSNFNVMGGTIMRSYTRRGQEGLPWDIMKIRLKNWLENITQIWKVQNEVMDNMIATVLPTNENVIEEIIGNLYIGAMKHAYHKGAETPFNTYELSDFVNEFIKGGEKKDVATVWDLYNWGTSIMKPGNMDIGAISENSNFWSDYLLDYFALPKPELEMLEV